MNSKVAKRYLRHKRVRKKVEGTTARPRVSVFRSLNNIYTQIIDDNSKKTLVSASTLSSEIKSEIKKLKKTDKARKVGELLAKKAMENNIKEVVFDRSGYLYHGRIKALADGIRKGGLKF